MTCAQTKSMFSAYLDGAVTGKEMHALAHHLSLCVPCQADYDSLRRTQWLLARMGPARVPEDLSLRLRLAISREAAKSRRPYFESLVLQLDSALRAFMVPVTTGLVATILVFGAVAGLLASPPSVRANTADVPLMLATDPELQPSSFGLSMGAISDDALVIEAYVDANGRVEDYRILSRPDDLKDLHEVKNMLILAIFRPATWMGTPRPGTAILSFSKISVKG
jgi:hypothetical protein